MADYPDVSRSLKLYKRAGELIPGWTQLVSRRASQFAYGISPIYAQRARGAHFIDVDGNEYVDWVSAVGAIILGYADEVVDQAVKAQIENGSLYSLNSPLEIELAEELVATIPSAEMVRYTKSGGEACALAVRIARGTTGRDKILFCGYHGWHDWYQAANYLVNPETGGFPLTGVEPIGVPRALAGTAIPFVYGDLDMLEGLLAAHRGEVAAIMMEPARSELPAPGYLKGVKALAQAHGALLIFDEVSCGWRLAVGGVQEVVGVVPDVTVVAKAMSNGYPMGAVVGSRAAMAPAKHMFVSSSYWSDNVGLAASLATIRELKWRDAPARFQEIGEKLRLAIDQALATAGLVGACTGLHTSLSVTLELPDEGLRPQVNTLFVQEMARQNVHCYPHFYLNLAHTEQDIQVTAEAAARSFSIIKSGLEAEDAVGDIDSLLCCETKKEPFRRLVR
jgi:glutamate-1-semialdehyde 2,1-aminomutase